MVYRPVCQRSLSPSRSTSTACCYRDSGRWESVTDLEIAQDKIIKFQDKSYRELMDMYGALLIQYKILYEGVFGKEDAGKAVKA